VIPEAGVLVPGIENILYVLSSYPDGRPASSKVFVDGTAYQTDAQGLSEVKIVPAALNQQFEIRAIEQQGKQRKLTYQSETNRVPPAFLLRADKAVYQVGQTARISVNSSEKNDTIFLDVIKAGQTVLTKSILLANHKAEYALALPATLAGALKLNAYFITGDGEDRGCSRIVYVNPASSLRIATSLSQPVYRPGEIARLDLSVTDAEGKPAPSALGIAAVDESVFALHENRPGLLQQFLDAEGELLKPRYQIKFFDSPSRLFDTENQPLAKAYFASLAEPRAGDLDELVRSGYVPQRLIDHAREMRGTPAYEKYRSDPQYADAMRMLEGAQGVYSLREATGLDAAMPPWVQEGGFAAWAGRVDRVTDGHADQPLPTGVLVRPDGVVAWATDTSTDTSTSTDTTGLESALHRWTGAPSPSPEHEPVG